MVYGKIHKLFVNESVLFENHNTSCHRKKISPWYRTVPQGYCDIRIFKMMLLSCLIIPKWICSICLQWRVPLGVTLIYRFILTAYTVFWLAYTSRNPTLHLNDIDISIFDFLTTWTYIVLTLYLVVHFLWVVIFSCKVDVSIWSRLTTENHRRLFHELQVQPSLWANDDYENIPGTDSSREELINPGDVMVITPQTSISFLPKLVWLLYTVASLACFLVTIIFWTMLYPQMGSMSEAMLIDNFELHAVTSIIIVLEHCVSAIPIRLFHFFYALAYGLIYIIFSGILYGIDHRYVLYPHVLDWSSPGPTVVVCCITAFVALPILHLLFYGAYSLKLYIFNRCYPEEL